MTSPDTTAPKIGYDCVALDCADAAGVAQFYADLLGGTVDADPDGDWFNVVWDGPRIATQLAPDHESPDWPRGQQQAHLDFVVADISAARRLQTLTLPDLGERRFRASAMTPNGVHIAGSAVAPDDTGALAIWEA